MTHITEAILRQRLEGSPVPVSFNPYTILQKKPIDTNLCLGYDDFALRVRVCGRCSIALRRRWMPVPPNGDTKSLVAFVGRCPSPREGREGRLFPRGAYRTNLMEYYMEQLGLESEPYWFTNACFCDCGGVRPTQLEVRACSALYKGAELSMLGNVRLVMLWGLSAVRSVLSLPYQHISDVLGYIYKATWNKRTMWLIPMLHPVSLSWTERELGKGVNECLCRLVKDKVHQWLGMAVPMADEALPSSGISNSLTEGTDVGMNEGSTLNSNHLVRIPHNRVASNQIQGIQHQVTSDNAYKVDKKNNHHHNYDDNNDNCDYHYQHNIHTKGMDMVSGGITQGDNPPSISPYYYIPVYRDRI